MCALDSVWLFCQYMLRPFSIIKSVVGVREFWHHNFQKTDLWSNAKTSRTITGRKLSSYSTFIAENPVDILFFGGPNPGLGSNTRS